MQQGETSTKPNGRGASILYECSNTSLAKYPKLTLVYPSNYDEATGHTEPAKSIEVHNAKELYDHLHEYFNS